MAETLEQFVAENYRARFLMKGSVSDVQNRFKTALKLAPELAVSARQRLASIEDIADDRCVITKTERDFIRQALGV